VQRYSDDENVFSLSRITSPEWALPTVEELKRRQEVAAKIDRRREEIGPIVIRADELKHQARAEAEG
jgi:hypothetical protein